MNQRMCAAAVTVLFGLAAGCSDDAKKPAGQEPAGQKPLPAGAGDAGKTATPGTPGAGAPENLPAEVVSLAADVTEVPVGGAAEVTARVVDAENDPFHVYWQSSCGAISPDPDQRSKAIFLAPLEPGSCKVTVEVQDGALAHSVTRSLDLLITPPADQDVADVQ